MRNQLDFSEYGNKRFLQKCKHESRFPLRCNSLKCLRIGMSIIAVLVCSLVVVGATPDDEGPTGGQATPSGSVSERQSPFSKDIDS